MYTIVCILSVVHWTSATGLCIYFVITKATFRLVVSSIPARAGALDSNLNCQFSYRRNPKGDWGIEIWSRGLLLTGSKTLAEVGRPFGCAGCIKFVVTSRQKGDVKSDASCKESATLFAR